MKKGLERRIVKSVIFLACLSFVSWQCFLSFERFLEKPTVTSLSKEFSKDQPYPRFTICPSKHSSHLNVHQDVLQACGVSSRSFTDQGLWTSTLENCSDTKLLYENAMNLHEDLIVDAKIEYFAQPGIEASEYTIPRNSHWWKPVHKLRYGRCYELSIPKDNVWIRKLTFYLAYQKRAINGSFRVYMYSPGYFLTSQTYMYTDFSSGTGQGISWNMEHALEKVVKLGRNECNPDPEYSVDDCVQDLVFNVSMSRLGCTSPWGLNQDHICPNQTLGLQAHMLFRDYFDLKNGSRLNECAKPCQSLKLNIGNPREFHYNATINGVSSTKIQFRFLEMITVANEYYSYTWLNLIAEVGGYVGLFLGFSVYQITDLLDKCMK